MADASREPMDSAYLEVSPVFQLLDKITDHVARCCNDKTERIGQWFIWFSGKSEVTLRNFLRVKFSAQIHG